MNSTKSAFARDSNSMRQMLRSPGLIVTWLALLPLGSIASAQPGDRGIFQGATDIGVPGRAGVVRFDAAARTYAVSGGGENMWFSQDAFHFVWIQVTGDVTLAADITFVGTGGHPHRKACLLVRQTLASDSAYADAALHGDGLTSLRYREFDIYTIPVTGGPETRLTTASGLDDGPDYSPDGRFIYFNSERSGRMQIWRMRTDGSGQEAVTSDEFNNWFPHPSPDGKWLVFLSYDKEVKGHPENRDVTLRLLPLGGGRVEVLAKLLGGQGTINVPSWSPDSRRLAFVSYQFAD